MDIGMIKYTSSIYNRERQLIKELEKLNNEINEIDCPHNVSVRLDTLDNEEKNRCITCGRYLTEASLLSIDARGYVKDRMTESEMFSIIQALAIFTMESQKGTDEEFVDRINKSIEQGKQKSKTK